MIVGFTSGIGVIIFIGQLKDFFELSVTVQSAHFHEKLFDLFKALPNLHFPTTSLGCLTLLIIILTPKFTKRLPVFLTAIVISTVIQAIFQFKGVATVGSVFGKIPSNLPSFHLPRVSFDQILALINPAFAIALLGAIESLLSAAIADSMMNTRHNSNQELIGQGLANIICPLFGGFAATGAIARTAANIRSGGNSPLSSITHSLTLLSIIYYPYICAINCLYSFMYICCY